VAEGEGGLTECLSHGRAGRALLGYRQLLSRGELQKYTSVFSKNLPNFLCQLLRFVWGHFWGDWAGFALLTHVPRGTAKKCQAELRHHNTGGSEKKPSAACERNNKKIFLTHPFPKNTFLPKTQVSKMLLHLFCTSLFTATGLGQAPHHVCCRMWP